MYKDMLIGFRKTLNPKYWEVLGGLPAQELVELEIGLTQQHVC